VYAVLMRKQCPAFAVIRRLVGPRQASQRSVSGCAHHRDHRRLAMHARPCLSGIIRPRPYHESCSSRLRPSHSQLRVSRRRGSLLGPPPQRAHSARSTSPVGVEAVDAVVHHYVRGRPTAPPRMADTAGPCPAVFRPPACARTSRSTTSSMISSPGPCRARSVPDGQQVVTG